MRMYLSAREESRTPTDFTPQASETCASTNFATRAIFRITMYALNGLCPRRDSNSHACWRHPLKMVRLPISPLGQGVQK